MKASGVPAKIIIHAQNGGNARWTKKNAEVHYGYKNHVKADAQSKLRERYAVTDASVHDSQKLAELVAPEDGEVYADSAYRSAEAEAMRAHDPSTSISAAGRYWIFYSGHGCKTKSSTDLLTWHAGAPVFTHPLSWWDKVAPGTGRRMWAPDIIRVGARYYLYYAIVK